MLLRTLRLKDFYMRVLFVTAKRINAYQRYFLELILKILNDNKSFIEKETKAASNPTAADHENEIIQKELDDDSFSFFRKLYLLYFIKKQKIQWLVQFADNDMLSSRLPQLIIPINVEKIIIKKAVSLSVKWVVSSQWEKQQLMSLHPFIENNIFLVPASASSSFQPLSWSERQAVKMQYTQGKEYFIANAKSNTEATFTSLLKAFSAFKKWQHSSMKLVVCGKLSFTQTTEWKEKINSYKYRDDVVMISAEEETSIALLASAYAFLHTSPQQADVISLLEAMQCETPCLSFSTNDIKEYAGDAAILIDNNDYEQLSDKMILLYKDEALRSRLIEEGKKQAQLYTREKALQMLYCLLSANIH